MAAVAFEPHENVTSAETNVPTFDKPIVITHEKPYVTNDPALIAALDGTFGVKRVAKGETKKEALAAAEAKS
jgi:hypothetical protein